MAHSCHLESSNHISGSVALVASTYHILHVIKKPSIEGFLLNDST